MSRSVSVFRIARASRHYKAADLSGAGAAASGGRWNAIEIPIVYASTTRAVAALETLVHLQAPPGDPLPLDRYLVEIAIPLAAWQAREVFDPIAHPGWDALPESAIALAWGSAWARSRRSLVAVVPSVIVPEEENVLLNPLQDGATGLKATLVREWLYDPRLVRR